MSVNRIQSVASRRSLERSIPAPPGSYALAVFLLLLAVSPTPSVIAADGGVDSRPRVGLVLGGGGAKGAAHIGVLRVLDELRIPIDCVAGTSMGALVGGTFASGMPVDEIERATTATDWSRTLGKKGLRERTPIERKLEGASYSNQLELGVQSGKVVLPGGLLKTQDIEDMIRQLISDARFQRDFDKLPIPFRAVATDMVTGDMAVLASGDLSVAMRASMSVPGAFSPVVIGQQVLADGGMVRNLPVDIVRDLCADVVIAIWLTTPEPAAADLDSALALVSRSMDVMIKANERAQIQTLTSADIGIEVPMGDIGSGDFQRVTDAIALGFEAAKAHEKELKRLSVKGDEFAAWRKSIRSPTAAPVHLADVRIQGLERISTEYVEAQLRHSKPGADVDSRKIKEDTDRVFALGDFQRIEHQLTGPPEARILEISPIEKPWGPDFLHFDLGLAAEGSGEILAILRADHTRAWIGKYGARWKNALQIGRQTLLSSEFYQPLNSTHDYFLRPKLQYGNSLQNVYQNDEQVAKYSVKERSAELALGANLGTRAQISAGVRSGQLTTERDTGAILLPEQDEVRDSVAFMDIAYDTRDDVGLPTQGSVFYLRYVNSNSWMNGEQDYELAESVFMKSLPLRLGDSLSLIVGGGKTLAGALPAARDFRLGGIRSFPGLRFDELRGTTYWFTGANYLWKLADIQSLFGQALYGGLRLQAARMSGRPELGADDDSVFGIAGSVSGRTPAGPFIISLGYVDNDSWELQFTLGRPVPEGSILDAIH